MRFCRICMGLDQNQQASTGNTVAVALVVAGIISLLTLGTAFALLILDVEFFWVAFPVGFGGVLPIALGMVVLRTTTGD